MPSTISASLVYPLSMDQSKTNELWNIMKIDAQKIRCLHHLRERRIYISLQVFKKLFPVSVVFQRLDLVM